MGNFASPAEWGIDANPGDFDNGIGFKGFGPGMENRIRPTSMYEMDREQISALKQAAQQGTPFKVQVGSKGIEHGYLGGMRDKAAVTEGGLTPNLLPPIQQLGPRGFWGLPYELTRVANFLPNVAMEGPGVAYFQHTANAAEAAYVAEGASKPDISPTVKEQYIRPAKVAGRILLTHELVQDAGDAFAQNLVADLARSLYNSESNLLLNGTTGANGFAGVNQVAGTLTRAAAIGTSDYDALDVLSKAFVDLRNDFFVPDLVFIHPNSLGAIRRLRDVNKRLQLELISGAGSIDGNSEQETLWGVPVVQTTQQAAGTAAVLSVASGAAVVYVREALTTFFDPYSQASTNVYQYIAETRLALATPRPQAINLVTGLPTS
jgi:HK97 family phage major capsid protein